MGKKRGLVDFRFFCDKGRGRCVIFRFLYEIEEIDVESLKNGHEEFKCSLCEFTSNDDETVKTHLINHVPKPPEKSVRTAKTKKEQELIIKAGSLLDLYDDDGNPLYDSTDSDSINNDE